MASVLIAQARAVCSVLALNTLNAHCRLRVISFAGWLTNHTWCLSDRPSLLFMKSFMLLLAHLVDGVPQILGHMKFIKRDSALRLGNLVQGGLDVGRPHIHRNALQPRFLRHP